MSEPVPGLTAVEAARRPARDGSNEPAPARRLSALAQCLEQWANPLVLILLAASAISVALGEDVDAGIIVTMVTLGVGINFW